MAKLNNTRISLIERAKGETEVCWREIQKKARVPSVHRTTAAKTMQSVGYSVKARPPRQKPCRSEIDEQERKRICNKLRKLPANHWQRHVHLYMDNKRWDIPTTAKGKRFSKMKKVRFHLRTRSEGLKKGFTKPNVKKHNVNMGCTVNLCAGIVDGRVRIWHYLPSRWCGAVAVDLYKDVVYPALVKQYGKKRAFNILEDNDPTGYKSKVAVDAKNDLGIQPMKFPTYSPDLNPLDFSLWEEVGARMAKQNPPKCESIEDYKARLRRTALAIPERVVRKMLADIPTRAEDIYQNDGGHIARD